MSLFFHSFQNVGSDDLYCGIWPSWSCLSKQYSSFVCVFDGITNVHYICELIFI